MITDHYLDKWGKYVPSYPTVPITAPFFPPQLPDPKELQEQLEEFQKLITRAKEYDKKNNEPDCELDEKRQALKKIADELGIEIKFL